jgi:hypothetical protein
MLVTTVFFKSMENTVLTKINRVLTKETVVKKLNRVLAKEKRMVTNF